VQCLDDSLRWFGATEVQAVQVSGLGLRQAREVGRRHLVSTLSWFSVIEGAPMGAVLSLASTRATDRLVSRVVDVLQDITSGRFEFGPLVPRDPGYDAGPDWRMLKWSGTGDSMMVVSMPEWSAAAVGWAIGQVFDVALSLDQPPEQLSVRVARHEISTTV